uniref:Toll-like receptor 5 membrane form n=1 Tax=Plecoglossus altivelis altivelis TaxID=281464 RepID=D2Z007_PLEAT|nr:Toll-like receptor 5 membrane form [Plecoglossus altivelis altivelis]BAI68384.1 Toll-like receptor 5 membrane form [Plecoglossus altivelis altivelis]
MATKRRNVALLAVLVYLDAAISKECFLQVSLSETKAHCSGCLLREVPKLLPPSTTHLDISSNYILEVNATSFSGLWKLLELNLAWQQGEGLTIRSNTFLYLRDLRRLYLGNSLRLHLEPFAFVGLSNLRLLSMFKCGLNESVLEDRYLSPLVSLEILDLFANNVQRIRPAPFFANMMELKELNLTLNRMGRICETDLVHFKNKHFRLLDLKSVYLKDMNEEGFDWEVCGNPFRSMSFDTLDLSVNGFDINMLTRFFKAIEGSKISHLVVKHGVGKGFSYNNFRDPDKRTYEGLRSSEIKTLDLSNGHIFALQEEVFRPFGSAEEINLSYNTINQINAGAFRGLERLATLNLSRNLLGEIHRHTFENLHSLSVLDLSYNNIGAFEHNALNGLLNLQGLDLRGNSIRIIPTLSPLPKLLILRLDDNKIVPQSLPGIISLASNSLILNVQNNRLTNLEDVYTLLSNLQHLQMLQYGSNFIMWCTLNGNISIPVSNSLKVLDLERSSLQTIWAQGKCLDLFNNLSQLDILTLNHNSLQSLPQGIFKGLNSVTFIDLSFNLLTYLQPDIFPKSLVRVDLSYNVLAHPDPLALRSLRFINLAGNLFYCDCNLVGFLTFLNTTNATFLSPTEELRCEFPSQFHGTRLQELNTEGCEADDEAQVRALKLSLFIVCTVFLVIIIAGAIAFAHLRGYLFNLYKRVKGRILQGPPQEPATDPDADAPYDAFLCFSNHDYQWVETALLKRLDAQFSDDNVLRCCFEARDFLPGENHLSNIRDAVFASRMTVCVVSREFLRDGWCLEAFSLAQGRMLEELRNMLIVVVAGKVPHYRLMRQQSIRTFIQKREYLRWPEDEQDLEWFYDRLISQILKNRKEAKERPDADRNNTVDVELENVEVLEMCE